MLELAERVIAMCKSRSTIVFRPLPDDDPRQRRPDITLARDMLGWVPKVGLAEGLGRTIEYFRQIMKDGRVRSLPRAKVDVPQERSLHAQAK